MTLLSHGIILTACIILLQSSNQEFRAANLNNEEVDQTDSPTAKFDDLSQPNRNLSLGMFSEAEKAANDQRYDRAIQLARRSLDNNDDDLDLHRVYAEALEGKFFAQSEKERDLTLYKECLEEWLRVMRAGAGEERGLNAKGIGGIFDYLYKDDDRYILGRRHLEKLAGSIPRPWETDKGYLKRVLKQIRLVKGTIVGKSH